MSFLSIVVALLGLSFLIVMHEWGHFLVARLFRIPVRRFSLGFGPILLRYKAKSGTEFAWSAILLGGYILFDTTVRTYRRKIIRANYHLRPPQVRMAVLIAGPLANLLIAYLMYVGIALIGTQGLKPIVGTVEANTPAQAAGLHRGDQIIQIDDARIQTWQEVNRHLISALGDAEIAVHVVSETGTEQTVYLNLAGIQLGDLEREGLAKILGMQPLQPQLEARIGQVLPDGPGARAGLLPGDKIVALDGQRIASWQEFIAYLADYEPRVIQFTLERQGRQLTLPIRPDQRHEEFRGTYGFLGIQVAPPSPEEMAQYLTTSRTNFAGAWSQAGLQTRQLCVLIIRSFYELIAGHLALTTLAGPISIVKYTGDSLALGAVNFLFILAFISLSLFIFNLLPLPMLDGGQLLMCSIELVRRKPPSEKFQLYYLRFGLIFFIALFVFVTINDIARLL